MKESFDLDQALERMKQETPEVPADFHARWMDAVRGEAEASAPPAADKKKGVAQWRRILSMVAITLFLVGGTLLTRGRLNAMILKKNGEPVQWKTAENTKTDPEKEEAVSATVENAPAATEAMAYNATAGNDMAAYEADAYYEANDAAAGGMASTEARRSAIMTAAAGKTNSEAAPEREEAAYMDAGMSDAAVMDESAEMEESAEMDEAPELAAAAEAHEMTESSDRAVKARETGALRMDASMTAVSATNVPATEALATEAPAAATEENGLKSAGILATSPDASSSFWEQVGAFFADMGRFILYALPVILGAAALAIVIALIDRRRKARKRDSGKTEK